MGFVNHDAEELPLVVEASQEALQLFLNLPGRNDDNRMVSPAVEELVERVRERVNNGVK